VPLFRRRPLLRAAAVGGGAYAYGKHRANEQAEMQQDAYMQGQQSAVAPAPPPAPAPQPSSGGVSSQDVARLQELGKLHEQGILTDDEFAQQKALILGGG
jgi:Short C-terminal domain